MKKWFWSRFLLSFDFVRKKSDERTHYFAMATQIGKYFNRLFRAHKMHLYVQLYIIARIFWEYCTWTPIVLFFLKGCKGVSFKASLENVCLTFRSYIWKKSQYIGLQQFFHSYYKIVCVYVLLTWTNQSFTEMQKPANTLYAARNVILISKKLCCCF